MSPEAPVSRPEVQAFADPESVDQALCARVCGLLKSALEVKELATLVVSGGSTPRGFLRSLARQPLPWARVLVTLADERWVSIDDPDSNERMVKECLVTPSGAQFLSLRGAEHEPGSAVLRLEEQLANLGQFDLVVLGMGDDGHTASLFPQATNLAQLMALDCAQNCAQVDPVTAPYQRITMSLRRLLDSQQIILHVTGAAKRDLLQRAWAVKSYTDWPIVSVLKQSRAPIAVYLDQPLSLN